MQAGSGFALTLCCLGWAACAPTGQPEQPGAAPWWSWTPMAMRGEADACTEPPEGAPSSLRLQAEHTDKEHSRDSSTTSLVGSFDGVHATLTGPVAPCVRGRCASATVSLPLTVAEREAVEESLDRWALWTPVEWADSTTPEGPYRATTAQLVLRSGPRTARTQVQYSRGWRHDSEADGAERKAAEEAAENIRSLLLLLRRTAWRCHPEFKPGP